MNKLKKYAVQTFLQTAEIFETFTNGGTRVRSCFMVQICIFLVACQNYGIKETHIFLYVISFSFSLSLCVF
jgi:hypothetical protein